MEETYEGVVQAYCQSITIKVPNFIHTRLAFGQIPYVNVKLGSLWHIKFQYQ